MAPIFARFTLKRENWLEQKLFFRGICSSPKNPLEVSEEWVKVESPIFSQEKKECGVTWFILVLFWTIALQKGCIISVVVKGVLYDLNKNPPSHVSPHSFPKFPGIRWAQSWKKVVCPL